MLIAKMAGDFMWVLHYASLLAWSGVVICGIAFLRSAVFLNENKKWASGNKWLVVFLVLGICLNIVAWKNIFCIFPCIVGVLAVISFWQSNPRVSKFLAYPISFGMIIYDFSCHSVIGIVSESIILTSCTICLLRMSVARHTGDRKPAESNR